MSRMNRWSPLFALLLAACGGAEGLISSAAEAADSITEQGGGSGGSSGGTRGPRRGPPGEGRDCDGGRPPHGPPPQEAVDACASLTADAACSFTHDDHTITGTCRTGPDGEGALACAPARSEGEEGGDQGRPPHGPPPQEAVDACASLAADATCSFTHDDHTVTGTCRTGPDGEGALACAPARPPES